MNVKIIECPYCNSDVEIDVDFARKNGRVFCGTCCKSFDITIPDEPIKKNYDNDFWD